MKLYLLGKESAGVLDKLFTSVAKKEGETLLEFKLKEHQVLDLNSRGVVNALLAKSQVEADANFVERVVCGEFTAIVSLLNSVAQLIEDKSAIKTAFGYHVLNPDRLRLVSMYK